MAHLDPRSDPFIPSYKRTAKHAPFYGAGYNASPVNTYRPQPWQPSSSTEDLGGHGTSGGGGMPFRSKPVMSSSKSFPDEVSDQFICRRPYGRTKTICAQRFKSKSDLNDHHRLRHEHRSYGTLWTKVGWTAQPTDISHQPDGPVFHVSKNMRSPKTSTARLKKDLSFKGDDFAPRDTTRMPVQPTKRAEETSSIDTRQTDPDQNHKSLVKTNDIEQPTASKSASSSSTRQTYSEVVAKQPNVSTTACKEGEQRMQQLPLRSSRKSTSTHSTLSPQAPQAIAKVKLTEPLNPRVQCVAPQVAPKPAPSYAEVCKAGASLETRSSQKRSGDDEADAQPKYRRSLRDLRNRPYPLEDQYDGVDQDLTPPVRSKSLPLRGKAIQYSQNHQAKSSTALKRNTTKCKSKGTTSNDSQDCSTRALMSVKFSNRSAELPGSHARNEECRPMQPDFAAECLVAAQSAGNMILDTLYQESKTKLYQEVRELLVDGVHAKDDLSDSDDDMYDAGSLAGWSTNSEELECADEATWRALRNGVIIDKFLDDIEYAIDHVMSGYLPYSCPNDAGGKKPSSATTTNHVSSPSTNNSGTNKSSNTQFQISGQSNGTPQGGGQNPDDSEEDDDGDTPKNLNDTVLGIDLIARPYACYYYSRDARPSARRACKKGYKDLFRLNEHLARAHMQKQLFCERCGERFDNADQRSKHMRRNPICTSRDEDDIEKPDGITQEQSNAIKLVMKDRQMRNEVKWTAIFQIIFPDVRSSDVPVPWILLSEEERLFLNSVTKNLEDQLPAEIERHLREKHSHETLTPNLANTIRASVGVVVKAVRRKWGLTPPTEEADSSPSPNSRKSDRSGKRKATYDHVPRMRNAALQGWPPSRAQLTPLQPVSSPGASMSNAGFSSHRPIQSVVTSLPSMSYGSASVPSMEESVRTPERLFAHRPSSAQPPVADAALFDLGGQTTCDAIRSLKGPHSAAMTFSGSTFSQLDVDDNSLLEDLPISQQICSPSSFPDTSGSFGIGSFGAGSFGTGPFDTGSFGTGSFGTGPASISNPKPGHTPVHNMNPQTAMHNVQWASAGTTGRAQLAQPPSMQTQRNHHHGHQAPIRQPQILPPQNGYPFPFVAQNANVLLPSNSKWASQNQSPTNAFLETPGPFVHNNFGGNT